MDKLKLNKLLIAIIIILVILLAVGLGKYQLTKTEKDYYKEQMFSFCGIVKAQTEIINKLNPELLKEIDESIKNDCSYWILNWDKR